MNAKTVQTISPENVDKYLTTAVNNEQKMLDATTDEDRDKSKRMANLAFKQAMKNDGTPMGNGEKVLP